MSTILLGKEFHSAVCMLSFTLLNVCMYEYKCVSRAGRLQLWEAVVVDIGSLVVVVFNGLRPLRFAFTAD